MNSQPYNPNHINSQSMLGVSKVETKKKRFNIASTKYVIALVIGLQLLMIGLLAYALYVPKNTLGEQIVKEVRKVAGISESLIPLDVLQIDENMLTGLRDGNVIQEEVYKDVQPGDYVVIYEDRMVVYRRNSKEVVYSGKTPAQIAQDSQVEILNKILTRAKSDGLIEEGNEEVPQASVVEKPQELISKDAQFYSRVQKGDIIVVFPEHELILLYNPNNDSIYNSGKIETVIEEL